MDILDSIVMKRMLPLVATAVMGAMSGQAATRGAPRSAAGALVG